MNISPETFRSLGSDRFAVLYNWPQCNNYSVIICSVTSSIGAQGRSKRSRRSSDDTVFGTKHFPTFI
jgi:hypothetical protein